MIATASSGPATARLLVIQDDHDTLNQICRELTAAGYTVIVSKRVDGAFDAAPIDLVLLGMDCTDVDSLQLLARIKAATPPIPVLMLLAADVAPEAFAHALDVGADDYIRAPFNPTMIRTRVGAALERHALRKEAETNLQKLQQLSRHLQDVVLPLGLLLSTEKDIDLLLYRFLLEAKKLCCADAGTLYVRTKDDCLKFSIMLTDSLGIALGGPTRKDTPFPPLRLTDPDTGAPNHRNIATWVALHGRPVNIADIYGTEEFDFSATREWDQRHNYRSTSTLTVPLKNDADRVVAVLQLLNALDPVTGQVTAFNAYQQLVVESLASQAAVVFNNQVLLQRQKELLTLEHDLQIGRQIQRGFLPETLPSPAGFQIAALFQPAREVAGDFYDAFMLGPATMGFVVADVCDKGVGAALFMALVRSLVRVYTQQRYSILAAEAAGAAASDVMTADEVPVALGVSGKALQQALSLANDYIGENHLSMNMFATMFAGAVDLRSGMIAFVNAGHNAPILMTGGTVASRLRSTGPAVGILPRFAYCVAHARLSPGDVLVVFSDGIPEARDPQGKFFTETRLLGMVQEITPSASGEQIASNIQQALAAHISTAAQSDDITLLVIRRQAPG